MSLLVICEVLGVFVNTLSVADKYFLHSSQNFPQRIEKQVSKKQKTFSQVFVPFLKLTFNFNCFFKKMTITVYVFPKLRTVKNVIRQKKKKKNFMAPFYGWGSTASRLQPLRGGSLLFTTQFPEIPGTHFIDLGNVYTAQFKNTLRQSTC